jgi:hypothetical protein
MGFLSAPRSIASVVLLASAALAQVHPGSMFSLDVNYDPIPHVAQIWTSSGYTLYGINIAKDADGYITSISTGTPSPMDRSMDQYVSTGSRNGNVYTAKTLKKARDSTTFQPWRKETWSGPKGRDTLIEWQDSTASGWTNMARKRIYRSGDLIDSIASWGWIDGAWKLYECTHYRHTGTRRDSALSWKSDVAGRKLVAKQTLFHGTDLDSIQGWSNSDTETGVVFRVMQRYAIVNGAGGKTASFTQQQWSNSKQTWNPGLGIVFSTQPLSIDRRIPSHAGWSIARSGDRIRVEAQAESGRWEWRSPDGATANSGRWEGASFDVPLPVANAGLGILVLVPQSGTPYARTIPLLGRD